jgi:hypothetical protein
MAAHDRLAAEGRRVADHAGVELWAPEEWVRCDG